MTPSPIIAGNCLLEKFPGKGGWTYAAIPGIKQKKDHYFGMLRVYGKIDEHPLNGKNLMPRGDGTLFLPVNATIRKAIGKGEGDYVYLELYPETPVTEEKTVDFSQNTPLEIPEEIMACFKNEPPEVYQNFRKLGTDRKRQWLQWIYEVRQKDARAERIIKMMDNLQHQHQNDP
ncbi:YdeI/OmpD-associated family protein [Sinomicrobium kalidii]|uniref:YdeI/OmpD-associated family protein n=1 Tax=Sinomicrobium kalidii TaxID=2900738 RepID=UPI001E3DB18D|nr:YdeI/OmpD-associated family protein [Sinomicrobium kalidii]UGU16941.1 YdeI/OmpD-associated family protein [Sinomicrobium kalidii]